MRRTLVIAVAIGVGTVALRGVVGTRGMDPAAMRLKSEFDFGFEQGHIAGNLARGDGYSVCFGDSPPIPSAWASPLYPLMLAGIFRVWGVYSFESQIAVIWLNSIFHGGIAALLFLIGARLQNAHGLKSVGLIAVLLFLFLPSGWQFLHWAWCTHLLAMLILLHMFVLTGEWRSAIAHAAWSGVTLGLAMLADGATVMIAPISIVALIGGAMRGESPRGLKPAARWRVASGNGVVFVFAMLFILSPWSMRNGLTLGSWSPLRGILGTAMWMGNHPGAAEENYLGLHENPWHNMVAAKRFIALGECGFDADNRQRFIAELRHDPLRFVKSCAMRASGFWFGQWWTGWANYPRVYAVGLLATTLLATAGIWKSLQRGLPMGVYIWVVLLYPLPYYATFLAYGRYRYPIEPVLCLMAALAVCGVRNFRVASASEEFFQSTDRKAGVREACGHYEPLPYGRGSEMQARKCSVEGSEMQC